MGKMFYRGVFVIILGVLFSFSVKGIWISFHSPAKTVSVHSLTAIPPGNKAPSEEFLIEYANFKELQKEVRDLEANSKLIEKRKLLRGTIDDLNDKVPVGYTWDEDTTSFKPRTLPTPPPQPTPAPEVKKP